MQCLKVDHQHRPADPGRPDAIEYTETQSQEQEAAKVHDKHLEEANYQDPPSLPLPRLRDNLLLVKHLRLISLPYPPDPHAFPSSTDTPDLNPEPRSRSKADIIRRSLEVLSDFELYARAGPPDQYRGLFPNIQTLTVGITTRNVLLRDDLPGGVGRVICTKDTQVGLQPGSLAVNATGRGGSLSSSPSMRSASGPAVNVSDPVTTQAEDQGAHNEIRRIRLSILGQKGAVISAIQKLISLVAPPITYATQDSVYPLPGEGVRADGAVETPR